jgi:hypothetical protein
MSFTADDELVIRQGLQDKLVAASITYPLPSPIQFVDKADFWATVESSNDTQIEIETELIKFCVITLRRCEDLRDAACDDQPLIRLTYNLYLFGDVNAERQDETDTPDAFDKLLLKAERDFMTGLFNIRAQFVGLQPMTGLPTGYDANTNEIGMDQYIRENDICRYVPDCKGFSADMQTVVEVLING